MHTAAQTADTVSHGNWVFTRQFNGTGTFEEQAWSALSAMKAAAFSAGMEPENYIHMRLILQSVGDIPVALEQCRRVLGNELPCLTIVQEPVLQSGSLFSVEAVGVKTGSEAVRRYGFDENGVPAAARAGDFVYTSACLCDPSLPLEDGARQALEKMLRSAAAAGARPGDFVKNLITLKDCSRFEAFNKIYSEYFAMAEPPARTLYGIEALAGDSPLSVEGIAYLGGQRRSFNIVGNTASGLPFCQAMQAGEFLFISGQVGILGPDGTPLLELAEQIDMMERTLYTIGLGCHSMPEHFLKFNAYMRDVSQAQLLLSIHTPAAVPSSVISITQATGLAHPAIHCEMDAVCCVKQYHRDQPFAGKSQWPEDLQTPALVIDEEQLRDNIREYQDIVEAWGCKVRPHIKTHKIPEIARMQMDAGAVGIVCSKISEAEVFANAGISNIFLAYPIIGRSKLLRLAALNRKAEKLYVEVESLEGAQQLSAMAQECGQTFHVIANVDVAEYGRVGFPLETAVPSILAVSRMPGLQVDGVYAYAYMCIHGGKSAINALEAGVAEGRQIVHIAQQLREQGLQIQIVAGGSAPTGRYTAMVPGVTEVHPGTHVFYDAMAFFYGIVPQQYAARVVVTVVASNEKRLVIDGGSKTFSTDLVPDSPPLNLNGYGYVVEDPDLRFDHMSEEHGILISKSGRPLQVPIGTRLSIVPNHICPCIALHDTVYMENNGRLRQVRVEARGKVI